MIALIITLAGLFTYLLYETQWLKISLPQYAKQVLQTIEIPKARRFEFARCEHSRKHLDCHNSPGYIIPARTIQAYGHIFNFKEGCNICRANLLREVVKAQKPSKPPALRFRNEITTTPEDLLSGSDWGKKHANDIIPEPTIELIIDGKSIKTINGDYRRGLIKSTLKQYTQAKMKV